MRGRCVLVLDHGLYERACESVRDCGVYVVVIMLVCGGAWRAECGEWRMECCGGDGGGRSGVLCV